MQSVLQDTDARPLRYDLDPLEERGEESSAEALGSWEDEPSRWQTAHICPIEVNLHAVSELPLMEKR